MTLAIGPLTGVKIVTRKEAIAGDLKHYFTGVPCVYGHVAQRFCPSGGCVECRKIRDAKEETKEWFRKHYIKNKPKRSQQMKAHYAANKHLRYPRRLKKEYELTLEQFEAMLASQDNKCAICNVSAETRRLYVDHCHTSNLVRGLLCITCNFMLGYAYDKPDILLAGIEYLRSKTA